MNTDKPAPKKFLYLLKEDELRGTFTEWPNLMNLAVWVDMASEFSITVYREEEQDQIISRIAQEADMQVSDIHVIPEQEGYQTASLLFSDENAIIKMVSERADLVDMAGDYAVNYQFCLDEGIDPKKALEPATPSERVHEEYVPEPEAPVERPANKTDHAAYIPAHQLTGLKCYEKDLSVDDSGTLRLGSLAAEDHLVKADVFVSEDFATLRLELPTEVSLEDSDLVVEGHGLPSSLITMFTGDVKVFVQGKTVSITRNQSTQTQVEASPVSDKPKKSPNRIMKAGFLALFGIAVAAIAVSASLALTMLIVDDRTANLVVSDERTAGELNFQELRDRILEGKPFETDDN